jgi:hypothetical protein
MGGGPGRPGLPETRRGFGGGGLLVARGRGVVRRQQLAELLQLGDPGVEDLALARQVEDAVVDQFAGDRHAWAP